MAERGTERKENLNIYQKIGLIGKQIEVIQKNKEGYGYKYVSEDEILAKISGLMDRYKLLLFPSICPNSSVVIPDHTKKTKSTRQGEIYEENVNEILVKADMVFTWVNQNDPGEYIEIPWLLVGHQSDGSQSFGSGLSYSKRYFLLKFFNVATPEDDPDRWRSKQKAANLALDKMIAQETINNLDGTVKTFLNECPDKSDEVKKFISKYVKDGNYFKISEPILASKLLSEFKEKFITKE